MIPLFIRVEGTPGQAHEEWAEACIVLASKLDCAVIIEVNEVRVPVFPDDKVKSVVKLYCRLRTTVSI